ncbi:hypothetical protein JX265_005300 [Neoarthrinium moseri]|uniref:Alternative oxidase n=1 Tax=Neoarthrinium moseri TaxID=1658444 RepID=A0A9Q0AR68_9PEZI|nr:hypothetical protein JX265_005300 [Neoarthrinium moseri]
MIDSSRAFGLLKLLAALAVFGWSLSFLGYSADYEQVLRQFKGEKALFVEDYLSNEFGGMFDGSAMSAHCASRNWTKGLLFHCEPPAGGIGQVRNAQLNCIRFAMEAGAELIVPEIIRRSDVDISVIIPQSKGTSRGSPLDYYFDKEYFNWTMSTACPQMKLHWSINDFWNVPMGNPIVMSINELGLTLVNGTIIENPKQFSTSFDSFFETRTNPKTRTWPFRVIVSQNPYAWPTAYDPPAFVRSFGRLLRYRVDARQLAASAMHTLHRQWIKPQSNLKAKAAGHHGYVGVHLRTEKDVQGTHYPQYEVQAAYYLEYIVRSPFRIAYLASGTTAEHIRAFTTRAQEFNITVLTKKDLLDPEELQYLKGLSWDQQAIVDFDMMLRANLMAGISESNFAWTVALKRAASGGAIGGYQPVPREEYIRWQDDFSTLYGHPGSQLEMQYSIWP